MYVHVQREWTIPLQFWEKGSLRDRGRLLSPTAIAIDSKDLYIYVSVCESNFGVSIFDKEGCFMKAFGNDLKDVKAMHINSRGNLYVCESRNNHVSVFSVIKPTEKFNFN